MLTGPSAAGKTTTAHKLAERIAARGLRSAVMSLDDFFVGEGRYPKQPDGSDDYECVESLDLPLLRACLRSLAETGVCEAPVFSFLTQRPTGRPARSTRAAASPSSKVCTPSNRRSRSTSCPPARRCTPLRGPARGIRRGGRFPRAGHAG